MVGPETGAKVDRPLARDVVRYFDVAYLTASEMCGDNVISIDVPGSVLAMSPIESVGLHTVLHVANPPQRLGGRSSVVHRLL